MTSPMFSVSCSCASTVRHGGTRVLSVVAVVVSGAALMMALLIMVVVVVVLALSWASH